jgi:hypothetical protein
MAFFVTVFAEPSSAQTGIDLSGTWRVKLYSCKGLLVLQKTANAQFFVGLLNEVCKSGKENLSASQEVKVKMKGGNATLLGTLLPGEHPHGFSADSMLLTIVDPDHLEGWDLGYPDDTKVTLDRAQ